MAEMDTSHDGGRKHGPDARKGKKLSTRIDLTPMVDLGFLLITFFMYTTTMARPKSMELNMPVPDPKVPSEVRKSTAMTILLSKDHRIYFYEGIGDNPANPPKITSTDFGADGGIRDAIIEKKKAVAQLQAQGRLGPKDNATFLIKPDDNSTYEDLVSILDEMEINDARVYAVVDITPQDRDLIAMTEAAKVRQ